MRDHYAIRVACRVTKPVTLNERARFPRVWWEMARWLLRHDGLLAHGPAHVGAFLVGRRIVPVPSRTYR